MCSAGVVRIVGDKERRHHDKNMEDGRSPITMLRVGTLGGVNGSVVLLESGKNMHKRLIRIFRELWIV